MDEEEKTLGRKICSIYMDDNNSSAIGIVFHDDEKFERLSDKLGLFELAKAVILDITKDELILQQYRGKDDNNIESSPSN